MAELKKQSTFDVPLRPSWRGSNPTGQVLEDGTMTPESDQDSFTWQKARKNGGCVAIVDSSSKKNYHIALPVIETGEDVTRATRSSSSPKSVLDVMPLVIPSLTHQETFTKLTRLNKHMNNCVSHIESSCLQNQASQNHNLDAFLRSQNHPKAMATLYDLMRSPDLTSFWEAVIGINRGGAPRIASNIISRRLQRSQENIPVAVVKRLSIHGNFDVFNSIVYDYDNATDLSHPQILEAVFAHSKKEFFQGILPRVCQNILEKIPTYDDNEMETLAFQFSKLIDILMDPLWLLNEFEREYDSSKDQQVPVPSIDDKLHFVSELVFCVEFCRLAHILSAYQNRRRTVIQAIFDEHVQSGFSHDFVNILNEYIPGLSRTQGSLQWYTERYQASPQSWYDEFGGTEDDLKEFQSILHVLGSQIRVYGEFGDRITDFMEEIHISRIPKSCHDFQKYWKILYEFRNSVGTDFDFAQYLSHLQNLWVNRFMPEVMSPP